MCGVCKKDWCDLFSAHTIVHLTIQIRIKWYRRVPLRIAMISNGMKMIRADLFPTATREIQGNELDMLQQSNAHH